MCVCQRKGVEKNEVRVKVVVAEIMRCVRVRACVCYHIAVL